MVTLKGETIRLKGAFLKLGEVVPEFELVTQQLERRALSSFEGQFKLLNIFPSVDTKVCSKSLHEFQERLHYLQGDISLLHISKDLPFAHARFCQSLKEEKVLTLSAFDSSFGEDYGLLIENGPLKGLLTRAVLLLDAQNKLLYQEIVSEMTQEPNYGQVFEALETYLKSSPK